MIEKAFHKISELWLDHRWSCIPIMFDEKLELDPFANPVTFIVFGLKSVISSVWEEKVM